MSHENHFDHLLAYGTMIFFLLIIIGLPILLFLEKRSFRRMINRGWNRFKSLENEKQNHNTND
jgi:hypothetical protein